jgi:hypothetical protein
MLFNFSREKLIVPYNSINSYLVVHNHKLSAYSVICLPFLVSILSWIDGVHSSCVAHIASMNA